jgi:DNA-binding beta-propeller fold protein YncE
MSALVAAGGVALAVTFGAATATAEPATDHPTSEASPTKAGPKAKPPQRESVKRSEARVRKATLSGADDNDRAPKPKPKPTAPSTNPVDLVAAAWQRRQTPATGTGTGQTITTAAVVAPQPAPVVGVQPLFGDPVGGVVTSPDGSTGYQTTTVRLPLSGRYFTVVTPFDAASHSVAAFPVILPGRATDPVTFTPDGTRAVVNTVTTAPAFQPPSVTVTLIDTARHQVVGRPVEIEGTPFGWNGIGHHAGAVLSPEGDRVFQATERFNADLGRTDTVVTIIDTADSTVTGSVAASGFNTSDVVISGDGARGFVTTSDPGGLTSRLTIFDAATGALVGQPVEVDGSTYGAPVVLDPDGTRAYQVSSVGSGMLVTVVDTADGTVVGDPIEVAGERGEPLVVTDDRAYLTTSVFENGADTTLLTVIDTATGTADEPVTLDGTPVGSVVLGAGGLVGYQTVTRYDPVTQQDSLAVYRIDTATGSVVGQPFTAAGTGGPVILGEDGSRAYLLSAVTGTDPGADSTILTIIDTADHTIVGAPIVVDGARQNLVVSPDGGRAYLTTAAQHDGGHTATVTAIDTADGSVTGSTTVRDSYAAHLSLSHDGRYGYLTTQQSAFFGQFTFTQVSLIDLTGPQL